MKEKELEKKVRKRVRKIRDFYSHLVVYIVINLMLAGIWFFTSKGFPWFLFSVGGWGIGLFFHWYSVFVEEGILGRKWEDRKVEEMMDRERSKNKKS